MVVTLLLFTTLCVHSFTQPATHGPQQPQPHPQPQQQRSPLSSTSELLCRSEDSTSYWGGLHQEWAGYPISSLDNARSTIKSAAAVAASTTIGLGHARRAAAAAATEEDAAASTTATTTTSKGTVPAFNEAYTGASPFICSFALTVFF